MSVSTEFSAVELGQETSKTIVPRRLQKWFSPPAKFSLAADHADRQGVEGYIAQRFEREYAATINEFMPHLVKMTCCGKTSAAVGIRCGAEGNLFVEQYLNKPIEQALQAFKNLSPRSQIVELGNLVASHRGASQLLFLTIANSLYEARMEWIVFAATRQVAKIVAKFPCETFDLGAADRARLGDAATAWGSYYDTNPRVIAMHLPTARDQIESSSAASMVLQLYQHQCQLLGNQLFKAFQVAAFRC